MKFYFNLELVGEKVSRLVRKSRRADQGFSRLLEYCAAQCPSNEWSKLADWDVERAASEAADRVREILISEPIGRGIRVLFFGLFEAEFPGSKQPAVAFYLGGLKSFDADDLDALGEPAYLPTDRLIRSDLLDAILRAAHADHRAGEFIFYSLLLGTGALLAKHATRGLAKKYRLVVGFDDGDVIEV
jgi:hypothetical protein